MKESENFTAINNVRALIINLNVHIFQLTVIKIMIKKNNFMAAFHGWGSTPSRLQGHYEERVFFLPLLTWEFLVLI